MENVTRESLVCDVERAKGLYDSTLKILAEFHAKAENNVFKSLEEAGRELEDRLLSEASDDCAGAGNCGCEMYNQEFMVDGIKYMAELEVEYDRHDKTYYYIDEASFSIVKMENA